MKTKVISVFGGLVFGVGVVWLGAILHDVQAIVAIIMISLGLVIAATGKLTPQR